MLHQQRHSWTPSGERRDNSCAVIVTGIEIFNCHRNAILNYLSEICVQSKINPNINLCSSCISTLQWCNAKAHDEKEHTKANRSSTYAYPGRSVEFTVPTCFYLLERITAEKQREQAKQ
ncbi:Uncharacterized protein Adt_00056 [Abeliophyllum distichum]|uniref:Uncharacterized protein n=1 Tax=Abeliophyllum distichum TaxID=126358 RepID=A0ABD1VQR6_9LAMI